MTSVSASEVLRGIARHDGERLVLEAGASRMTYAELDEASEALAAHLQRVDVARKPIVLCLVGTRPLLIATVALARAGLVSVPIEPSAPVEYIRRVCLEVGAACVLSDLDLDQALPVAVLNPEQSAGPRPAAWEDAVLGGCVSIVFTSGSTGEPKGIMISAAQRPLGAGGADHGAYGAFADALRAGFISGGSTNTAESTLLGYLATGATIVAYEVRRQGLGSFGAWLREANVFGFTAIPTVLRHVLPTLNDEEVFESVRMVFLSGETSTWEDVMALRKHLSDDAVVVSIFGTTETGPALMFAVDSSTKPGSGPLPLGVPLASREVEIVDDEGRDLPDGEIGEIVVIGRETSLGYWQRPAETVATFATVAEGVRRVKTGDLGRRLPNGDIVHHGRRDHVVKIAGNRVELGQVEAALRQIKGVADAGATTYTDSAGDVRLAAAVVAAKGERLSPTVLRVELARTLSGYMLPDSIALVGALPLLPGGKIDRRNLPIRDVAHDEPGDVNAPTSELEKDLIRIWERILGARHVRIDDSFFMLGGDSLRGARLLIELERRYGVDFPVSVLVEAPSIRQLAAVIETGRPQWQPVVAVRTVGSKPPLFVVHDGSGDVVFAHPIADHVPEGVPVYGLRGEVLDGRGISEQSVEELATRYIVAVRAVRPHGPYFLYGMSLGGTVAFEMARQLRAAGEEVPVLGLGDTPGPGGYSPQEYVALGARAATRLEEVRSLPLGRAAVHAARLGWRQGAFWLDQGIRRLKREPARYEAEEELLSAAVDGKATVPLELRRRLGLRVYGMLAIQYRPETEYDGRVTLIRSSTGTAPVENWQSFVVQQLEFVGVDGEHGDFGRPPTVHHVGRVLGAAIERALTAL